MRQADIDRKMFHKGHYEVIAGRFRKALEPYMSVDEYETEVVKVSLMTARAALVELAVSFAIRLQADNSDFDPVLFLNRCSFNAERYPLGELWPIAEEDKQHEKL